MSLKPPVLSEMSTFDKENIGEIIKAGRQFHGGYYDWTNAYVLQYLDRMLAKVDEPHAAALYSIYPEQCVAVLEYWGWSQQSIADRVTFWTRKNYVAF